MEIANKYLVGFQEKSMTKLGFDDLSGYFDSGKVKQNTSRVSFSCLW